MFTARPDQRRAVEAALAHLADHPRATVVSACGTGKTLIAALTAKGLKARRVLIVVPTLELLAQTARAWSLAGRDGRTGGVCGPQEILRDHADGHVTTDPAELAYLSAGDGLFTAYCTYASLPVLTAAHRDHGMRPWDLVVIDEAHRTAGLLGKAWGALHHDASIPAARRLYMTATPRIVDSDDAILASMDDEDLYGPVVHRLDTGDAITAGVLADYQILVPVLNDTRLRERVNAEEQDRARLTALQVAVLKATHEHGLTRLLTYHQRVATARAFAETLPDTARSLPLDQQPPALWSGWISGQHTPASRSQLLTDLAVPQHRPAILANSRVLGEGVDVPALDGVVFSDPRSSVIDIVQAVGRALRLPAGSSKRAVIIVPVFLAADESPEDALDSSAYAPLWRTLRALHAHDARLAERVGDLRTIRAGLGAEDDLGWLKVAGNIDPRTLAAAIYLRTVGRKSKEWRIGYQAARSYHAAHGHLNCPQAHIHDGVALGKWISWQRHLQATKQLPEGRRVLLDELGMVWQARLSQWDTSLGYARRYAAEHGHLVPDMSEQIAGFPIGRWLRNLRVRADEGEVPAERIAQLAEIDPNWNPPWRTSWQRAYYQALAFQEEHGHLDVPASYRSPDGTELGTWLKTQRSGRDKLTEQQVKLLEEAGIEWETLSAHERKWRQGLAAATRYHAVHGDLECTTKYVDEDGFRLGMWLSNKRNRSDRLSPDQRAALDNLNMRWREPSSA
ncbi:DEAD/DEAH box helicase [Streptomyces solaniscabiei]|uniref:DEAD/DEAH box helicase n=1 Tax=Streptomyces solaniscabiei TaxID=2683255 RepID=UPI001CE38CF1|nr:DEAD/DEAH box helicase [Streptomyces solaniscabiei]